MWKWSYSLKEGIILVWKRGKPQEEAVSRLRYEPGTC
jgi:hypothetical protein